MRNFLQAFALVVLMPVSSAYAQSTVIIRKIPDPAESFQNALSQGLQAQQNARAAEQERERLRIEQERLQLERERLQIERTRANGPALSGSEGTKNPNTALNLEEGKKTCAEIGFAIGTEKFGECVLKISSNEIGQKIVSNTSQNKETFSPIDGDYVRSIMEEIGWTFIKSNNNLATESYQFAMRSPNGQWIRAVGGYKTLRKDIQGIYILATYTDRKLQVDRFQNDVRFLGDQNLACAYSFDPLGRMQFRYDILGIDFYKSEFIQIFDLIAQQQQWCVSQFLSN
jgi:hypothetical protein